ncbi:MAG: phosphodiester glycosidase family protein [Solirubrobacterales bacterium]
MAAIATGSLPGALPRALPTPVTFRAELSDGVATTVHMAAYDLATTDVRVVALARTEPLLEWCTRARVAHAIVGGFFVTSTGEALGELRAAGIRRPSVPFTAPWGDVRSCVQVKGGDVRIARRAELPADPRGDLLQAGPLLVLAGEAVMLDGEDPEGFTAASEQFDSDITAGRHPRAALGVGDGVLLAVVCDGRATEDAGLSLGELADLMASLGAREAINLDGGGSASLVCDGRLLNRPREQDGIHIPGGRPVATALAVSPRLA